MDIIDFLTQESQTLEFAGTTNVNWDKQARVVELEFSWVLPKEDGIAIEDQNGELNESDEILYEDAILFYDETKIDGQAFSDNYLTVIPFNGRQGLNGKVARACLNYLQDILDEGQSELVAFLEDDSDRDTFILNWDDAVFEQTLAEVDDQLAHQYYNYPKF